MSTDFYIVETVNVAVSWSLERTSGVIAYRSLILRSEVIVFISFVIFVLFQTLKIYTNCTFFYLELIPVAVRF